MFPENGRSRRVVFYGGPLHGRELSCEDPPDHWISSETVDCEMPVTVEYRKAGPWWIGAQDSDLGAVYICMSWVASDGQMRSRHGYLY